MKRQRDVHQSWDFWRCVNLFPNKLAIPCRSLLYLKIVVCASFGNELSFCMTNYEILGTGSVFIMVSLYPTSLLNYWCVWRMPLQTAAHML